MSYKKFSDSEILESYTTAIDYSGKADKNLMAEIDSRGGLEHLKERLLEQNTVPDEIRRVTRLVWSYDRKDLDPDEIKSSITSDILSAEQLDETIDNAIQDREQELKDTSIHSGTIIGSLIGFGASSLLGAIIWCYSIMQTGIMYYYLITVVWVISYVIIRLLTGQSRNNVLVFAAVFVSGFFSIILGLWFVKLLTN